ncbi:MAG: hypothetical protein J6A55_03840 [Oscillospiraceae bacterium]|nr:hypothetical protein [Oscillospiraceae bacterium]
MFKYLFKNLKSLLTKQGVISLLLVVNIVVSALVICFSYGLYQNYNIYINEGEAERVEHLFIDIYHEYKSKDPYKIQRTPVTVGMVKDFIYMLSEDTMDYIEYVTVDPVICTDLYFNKDKPEEIGEVGRRFCLTRINGNIVNYLYHGSYSYEGYEMVDNMLNLIPEESDIRGDKVVVISDSFFNEEYSYDESQLVISNPEAGRHYTVHASTLDEGTKTVKIYGEDYEIIKVTKLPNCEGQFQFPFMSLPDDTLLNAGYLNVVFKPDAYLTERAYNDIVTCMEATMSPYVYTYDVKIPTTTQMYFYKTILIISLFIAVLAAVNMAILYRYILEKRSSELAILRICGCSKRKAVRMYLLECMLVNAPLFALTEYVYHKLIMPKLTGLFPHMEGAYSKKLYLVIFAMYVIASLIILYAMIKALISKHSLVEQKNSSKAKSRFGIMKVFEILQLSVVIGIAVFLVSAIASRYTYYIPFKDILTSDGYMTYTSSMYYKELEQMCPDCDITYYSGGYVPVDRENVQLYNYDDTLCNNYTPEMSQGVWLSDTDISYEKDKIIPIVVTEGSGFTLGQEIPQKMTLFNPDDYTEVIGEFEYSYRVVGLIPDRATVIGALGSGNRIPDDFNDFYSVYDYEFYEEKPYFFGRVSDQVAMYDDMGGAEYPEGMVSYVQFITSDKLTKEQKRQMENAFTDLGISFKPLSEVNENSLEYIYEQMYTLFPIALCIFILTVISAVSINAIYTKRQLRNYAIFYICGARWKTCALKSLKDSAITCAVASALCALILFIGKQSFLKETVISFGIWHAVVCLGVIALYLILSMIMPIAIIGSSQPKDVLKEE